MDWRARGAPLFDGPGGNAFRPVQGRCGVRFRTCMQHVFVTLTTDRARFVEWDGARAGLGLAL